jgi:hypothetical protein
LGLAIAQTATMQINVEEWPARMKRITRLSLALGALNLALTMSAGRRLAVSQPSRKSDAPTPLGMRRELGSSAPWTTAACPCPTMLPTGGLRGIAAALRPRFRRSKI